MEKLVFTGELSLKVNYVSSQLKYHQIGVEIGEK
jgi:hypothetical protein